MGYDDLCNTGLVLGLGFSSSTTKKPFKNLDYTTKTAEPSLTLGLSGENYDLILNKPDHSDKFNDRHSTDLYRQDSAASSFSNVSVKREREIGSEEVEIERVSSRASDEDDDGPNGRKKLRLTKAQSALLEESFKQHSTLNPKQKQDLARELKLRPRQVEVWFQNRRARTKLKQTEVDCEFLKKCCETLTEENRRLQKELQELKALKLAQPLYMQLPAATLSMCPSCERIGAAAADSAAKSSYVMAPTKPHFYNPFTNPSAAC
ncbi:Homeobox-leucine zipper protein hat22 [Salvia divinorum]|uniref:Homeobox-leucine zipper protein hat22 n=1 Tax=Salvia divinorum TaxID=28513 RepID=A0ABD1G1J9_SALDI